MANKRIPHVEAIVVNNGGIAVESIVERYEQTFQRPIHLVTLRTACHLAMARNAGAATARGDILALLDDDDRFHPTHLERLLDAFAKKTEAVVAYDDALLVLEESASAESTSQITATGRFRFPYEKHRFESDNYLITSALAIRRTAFLACGGFDRSLRYLEDWDILLRLREYGALLYVPGEIGVEYSVRLSANDNFGATFDQERRACLDWLTARYALPPLVPKTLYDVARDFGCIFSQAL